jgi:hypothetical protein
LPGSRALATGPDALLSVSAADRVCSRGADETGSEVQSAFVHDIFSAVSRDETNFARRNGRENITRSQPRLYLPIDTHLITAHYRSAPASACRAPLISVDLSDIKYL